MLLKKFTLLTLLTSLTSCFPSAYLIKEFQEYPEDLSKKDFIKYNLKRGDVINEEYISFRDWHRKNGYSWFNELGYFNLTYFHQSNEPEIFEAVKTLSELKKSGWVLPTIHKELLGIEGTIWVSKNERLRINKIQDENLGRLYESTQLHLNIKESKILYPRYEQALRYKNLRLQKKFPFNK